MNQSLSNLSNEDLLNTSLVNLKQSLIQQSRAQRRVADRVRILIRSVMVGLGVALLFILYLIFILTQQVNALSSTLDTISKQTAAVEESMDDIEIVMINFETYMDELPSIDFAVTGIERSMVNMSQSFSVITNNIGVIGSEFGNLKYSMSNLGQNTLVLTQVLDQVTRDVAKGVKPARRFNQMNPFNFMD